MGKGPRASSLTLSVCLSSIPCPGSIFHQLLALFLYGTCHCSPLAKLVHGSALFLWTRCPLLSPVLKLSPTWPSAGFGGGFTAATVSSNATSLALRSWNYVMMRSPLKHCPSEMPSMLTVRWNRDKDLLLQGLQGRISASDLTSTQTPQPPNCFCKPCSAIPNNVAGCVLAGQRHGADERTFFLATIWL